MADQIVYRTDLGVVAAARAHHTVDIAAGSTNHYEDGRVELIRTADDLDLLVAILAGNVYRAVDGLEGIAVIQRVIFDAVRVSTGRNILAILKDAVRRANSVIYQDPRWRGGGLTAVISVVYGKRLYLAQVGNCRAYLIRASQAFLLTQEHVLGGEATHQVTIPNRAGETRGRDGLLRYLGKDRNVYVDTQIRLPENTDQNYLDLGPNEGIILCTNGVVERALRQDALLDEDFFTYFQNQPAEVIANRMISVSARQSPVENHAAVVLKTDDAAAPVPVFGAGSCLSQVGIIATILILSILLGLGAAFGLPAMMNPKTSSIPNTGANLAQPGYLSVASAEGVAQITFPGQVAQNMTPGTLIEARPGSQITTARGKAKIQLVDGTSIYINDSSSLTLKAIANPKQNQVNTVLVLDSGGVMVDTSQTSDAVTVLLTIPGTARANAYGQFIGATFAPDQKRLDVDCLEGSCQISGSTASRDMVTGQRSWIINGVVGGLGSARWDMWAGLCDSDCPFQIQTTPTAPQPAPTFVPTPVLPIPYLGAQPGK